jgi:hypothetical protein
MATFHLKDWRRRSVWRRRAQLARSSLDANLALFTDWLISVALCLGLAMVLPMPTMPVTLAALLSLAGFVWLGLAITRAGPPVGSPHLTAWDAALLLFAASFGVQAAAHLGAFGA